MIIFINLTNERETSTWAKRSAPLTDLYVSVIIIIIIKKNSEFIRVYSLNAHVNGFSNSMYLFYNLRLCTIAIIYIYSHHCVGPTARSKYRLIIRRRVWRVHSSDVQTPSAITREQLLCAKYGAYVIYNIMYHTSYISQKEFVIYINYYKYIICV